MLNFFSIIGALLFYYALLASFILCHNGPVLNPVFFNLIVSVIMKENRIKHRNFILIVRDIGNQYE